MLIATLIITTVAMARRRFARRPANAVAWRRGAEPVRRALRRPVPVAATSVALLGIAVAAGVLAQC
ncbi:hypothetical protein ACRS6B_13425 [Nocardia asteroides]